MLDCLHKSILCTDSQGNQVKAQCIPKKVSVRQISSLQVNKCVRKGCNLFAVKIQDVEYGREQRIEDFPVLEKFKDMFPEEIPGSVLASQAPYRMSALELVELKL